MTKAEYTAYQQRFVTFMELEGLQNLSSGYVKCPQCGNEDWCSLDKPCSCGASKDAWEEPQFSWRACECCKNRLGGSRYHATGWSERDKCVKEFEYICSDCIYYAEYGRLDDTTMLEVEKSTDEPQQ